jgi:hypothetical protein
VLRAGIGADHTILPTGLLRVDVVAGCAPVPRVRPRYALPYRLDLLIAPTTAYLLDVPEPRIARTGKGGL